MSQSVQVRVERMDVAAVCDAREGRVVEVGRVGVVLEDEVVEHAIDLNFSPCFWKKGRTTSMVSPSLMSSSVRPSTSRMVALVMMFLVLSGRSSLSWKLS